MITKIKFQILLTLVSLLMIVPQSCETPLEELNVNPNQPATASIDLVFTHGANNVLYKYGRYTNGSDWDMWAGLWTQAFAGNHASGVNYDQYVVRNPDALWGAWYDGFLDLNQVITLGTENEAWTHVGASQVVTALGLGTLTSFYGDLPWSEALQGAENPFPIFDSQEKIYETIFSLLDDAVTNLNKTPVQTLGTADLWFGGDSQMWLATAHALIARYENHFSTKDPSGSANRALATIDLAKAAGFTSASTDLVYPYSGQGTYQNGFYDMWENNQMICSEAFMNALNAKLDPRKEGIWDHINFDGFDVGYIGKSNGFGTDNTSYSPVGPNTYFGKANSNQPIVTHYELLFIEAEAALRAGNTGRAATALNAGILAHINLLAPDAIALITTEGGDVTAYQNRIANYIANYASETSATVTLEKIMTEKHTAMVCINGESWVDVRRHDYAYPSWLTIPVFSGAPVATDFIERVLYPQESLNTNPNNTPKSVSIFDRLWIFKP